MPQTILIAINDPNILYLFQRYAEESGFHTAHASSGEDILVVAQKSKPRLIILEIGFPETAGRDVLSALKAEPTTRDIPVVTYSCVDEAFRDYSGDAVGSLKSVMYSDFLAVLESAGLNPEAWAQSSDKA
jgi:response regulator RpfG family c-di-GMP phosphodiesterase